MAIDFVGPLPKDDGFDVIVTMTDHLGVDIQIAPCHSNMTAEDFAYLFFDQWYCKNGCPVEIISDHDKLFILKFWKALMKLTGITHKLSTAYHPQTNRSSEHSNKTVIQCLCFHVKQNQKGWAKVLPKVRFDIMNTPNMSTRVSPFVLKTRWSPKLLPPLITTPVDTTSQNIPNKEAVAWMFIKTMEEKTNAAKDKQAHFANKE